MNGQLTVDVLCVGNAAWDITLAIDHQPEDDEKVEAARSLSCGGGPAANAAVCCARLGLRAAFAGYLSRDVFGQAHVEELLAEGVDLSLATQDDGPMRVSTIYVKPDGKRSIVHHAPGPNLSDPSVIQERTWQARVVLFDGYEARLSAAVLHELDHGDGPRAITVLDAGSVREGTRALVSRVDHLVASRVFARDFTGQNDLLAAAEALTRFAPVAVVTLGEDGLVWARRNDDEVQSGFQAAIPVDEVVDTTGAGDAFHGGYAAALAWDLSWEEVLRFALSCGAAACQRFGARPSMPALDDLKWGRRTRP